MTKRDKQPNVVWSHSRRESLHQCARRYYYEYYGSKKRTAAHDPDETTIRFLSSIQNRHLRTGAILHLVIRTYFLKAQAGDRWDPRRLGDWALKIFRADCDYSRRYPDGADNSHLPYPPVLLLEYHQRLKEADTLCAEAEDRLLRNIATFATGLPFEPFRLAGCTAGTLVERSFKLKQARLNISGVVDLAYQRQERVKIVDWKSGAGENAVEESLQLGVYSMWAQLQFDARLEQLDVFKVYLGSGELVECTMDSALLARTKARVEQDLANMRELHVYGDEAVRDAFTPCYQPRICANCPYTRLCYGGNESTSCLSR